jgi:Acetyltransferases
MLQLRPFTSQDYTTLVSWVPTLDDFYLFSGTRAPWPMIEADLAERAAREYIHAWTAVVTADQATPAGHIEFVRTAADAGRFARVMIAPDFRGLGLARHLIDAGLQAVRRLGIGTVDLNVVIGNEPALRTYAGMGFRRLGVNPDYPTMLQMTRDLETERPSG